MRQWLRSDQTKDESMECHRFGYKQPGPPSCVVNDLAQIRGWNPRRERPGNYPSFGFPNSRLLNGGLGRALVAGFGRSFMIYFGIFQNGALLGRLPVFCSSNPYEKLIQIQANSCNHWNFLLLSFLWLQILVRFRCSWSHCLLNRQMHLSNIQTILQVRRISLIRHILRQNNDHPIRTVTF